MKGFIALVLVALLGLSAYNYWEIRSLRQEIAALNEKVKVRSQTDEMVAKAAVALAQARDAMDKMDPNRARVAYETARDRLESAARIANEKAGPTVRWLRDEAANLGRQLQDNGRSR